jgi:uncharacterized protein (DUF1800 family)
MADRQLVAHLLRRATFGPTAAEIDAAAQADLDATVDGLLTPTGDDPGAAATPEPNLGPDPNSSVNKNTSAADRLAARQAGQAQVTSVANWWLSRMIAARHQLTEKLIFFWHGHWATSVQKVKSGPMMLAQLETFRRDGHGDFGVFVKAMLRDPALIFWLDGEQNTSRAPNENLARELMELFTLGIGNYTEDDVKQAARALTGWTIDRTTLSSVFIPRRHDNGSKTILGQTANFDADSFADLLLAQPAQPVHLANRLWFRFASGEAIPTDTQSRMVDAYGSHRDVPAMLRAMFTDAAFGDTKGQLVKQPVEWTVGALRQLAISPVTITAQRPRLLLAGLDTLGQVPLEPPSVGGWPSGAAWLTTSSAQARIKLATTFANAAQPATLAPLGTGTEQQKLNALARLLAVDAWTDRTRDALRLALGDPRRLVSVGLISPEYAVT